MALPTRYQTKESPQSDPMTEIQRLSPQLGRLLDDWSELSSLLGDVWIPAADVEETDDAYVVEIELPGVRKKDIDITVAGRRLIVTGERKEKERVGVLRRRTRRIGRFRYEVILPGAVDDEKVSATLDDGVLVVRVPKASSERPRRIEVK